MICRVILISENALKQKRNSVALRYVLVVVVRININYICTMINAMKIQCNLKGNHIIKTKSYTKLK